MWFTLHILELGMWLLSILQHHTVEVTFNPFVHSPKRINCDCRPALLAVQIQTKPHWATQICFSITEFDQAWSAMDLLRSRTKLCPTPQTNACCKLILNSCLWRKPERWIFLKVSVFCPQYFCSFWLNLFCFTHPVWTFKHLLCYTVTSCSLLALLRVTQTHHFLQCCFITKALEWLNNRVL